MVPIIGCKIDSRMSKYPQDVGKSSLCFPKGSLLPRVTLN